ncbi:MAG: restriction endonuclease subunit S [Paludibacter sp.]
MRLNYKKLGDFISPHNYLNEGMEVTELLGISNQKYFQKSHTNINGMDFSTYRIVRTGQFAFNRATTRNGEKISIALRQGGDCIVSPSYRVFQVNDENELLSEYLLMWFKRPEFDRYARFKSHGSAHEFFEYDQMCEVELPIPSITKQREIVKEYNIILDRINLNNSLIQKLEETAQAVNKNWFVDFEFPNADGKPYKSSAGEMIESELGIIPKGWRVGELQELILFKNGKTRPTSIGKYPVYGGNGIVEYINEFNDENIIAIGRVGAYCGSLYRVLGKCWISDNAISAKSRNNFNMFAFYTLSSLNLNERSEGTGQPLITQGLLNGIKIIVPSNEIIHDFEKIAIALFENHDLTIQELEKLEDLKNLLLSKLTTI